MVVTETDAPFRIVGDSGIPLFCSSVMAFQ